MDLLSKEKLTEKRNFILFFIIAVLGLIAHQFWIRQSVNNNGIYLKCKVINSEGYKGGILTTISYSYKTKAYRVMVHSEFGREKIGEQYFIKVLPSNPDVVLFLENNPVPDCLLQKDTPVEGWKQMPACY